MPFIKKPLPARISLALHGLTAVFGISCGTLAAPAFAAPDPAQSDAPAKQTPAVVAVLAAAAADSSDAGVQQIVVTGNSAAGKLKEKSQELDDARDKNLLPKFGATTYNIDAETINSLPQGKNTAIDKVLLQAPGVSYDSAISNPDFHVRNEYANVQYRINGIQLPDGVSALGPVLETGFIGNLNLLDGALPAQYGLRTAGVVDLTTKSEFFPGGNLDLNVGNLGLVSPSVEYGGSSGQSQYYVTARYLQSDEGLENAMPTSDPIHDRTTQEKFFAYGSTILENSSRLTYMAGGFVGHFQIPDAAGLSPLGDFGSTSLSSTGIDENETDRFFFALAALQTHSQNLDTQFSIFTRYASVAFLPDVYNDLAFNDVASNVTRKSLLNGLQFDAAQRLSDTHTLRAGVLLTAEKTQVANLSTVLPLDTDGNPLPTPETIDDSTAKLGWTFGSYLQDEWKLRQDLTLNTGLRFDDIDQFVTAHQFSPRIALIYKPSDATTVHGGISRYFTPPMQAQATPTNLALFQNTTQASSLPEDPVRPERATYLDVGLDQLLSSSVSMGVDVYYKHSTDTLDDGQFGQAVVLTQFNYAEGYSRGVEFKVNYHQGGLRAYANLAAEKSMVKDVVSNQYVIGDPAILDYQANTYTYPSDAQTLSASTGASYRWQSMLASLDGMYGSGLRAGFANEQHSPGYTQWNAAIARDFTPWQGDNPLTVRFSVVNLFDRSYLLRSGSGIGEFAPQYGPRRGLTINLSQKF